MAKEINYEKALSELESIARKMESGECDIDELASQLKHAQELIKLCKDKLTKADEAVKKVLEGNEE